MGEKRFSFAALNDLAYHLAGGLAEIGVGAGDRVTIYAANSWERIVSYYAVPKLGAVLNPINVMLTPNEVAYCREGLAAYKVPRAVQFVADLPKTTNMGKIMRRKLKTLDE